MVCRRNALAFLAAGLFVVSTAGNAQENPDTTGPLKFTFVHTSDTHIDTFFKMPESLESARSWKAVRTLKDLGSILLQPYGFTAQAPSFIINTGDIGEFGQAGVTEEVVEKYFGDLGVPVYYVLGNHDGTWAPPLRWMEKKFGDINYSFDFLGVHFVGLNSAGIQDPRPSFGQETLNFVKRDLAKVAKTTPIIVFFHHPLPGSEFSSRYDYDRVLDALEQWNIILVMDGHGHGSRASRYNNMDFVMGGSTFSKKNDGTDGYNIVSLDGEKLRIANRRAIDQAAVKPLLDKKIPERSFHPQITMTATQTGSGDARNIVIKGDVKQSVYALSGGTYSVDDELTGPLTVSGNSATVTIPASKLESGVHYARFAFNTSEAGVSYDQSMPFAVESGVVGKDPVAVWRYQMGGGSRTTPVFNDGKVFIGGNDGVLYALDAVNGKPLWTLDAKSPVTAAPAIFKDLIIFGTGDGSLKAVTQSGQLRWEFPTGTAIMGHPLVHNGLVYFASTGATVYCLDAASGQKKWEFADARFQVETKPVMAGDKLLFGAWDGNIYCLEAATGRKLWSALGPRNQTETSLPQYYAPADAELAVVGDKVFATDRAAKSGSYTLDGQYIKGGPGQAVAFAPAADGKHLYLRRSGSGVCKVDLDLNVVWESDIVAGSLPFAPVEVDGVVYGVTSTGRMYALDAANGKTLWRYRVTPGMYVHTSPTVANGMVYTIGQDGVVTAVRLPVKQ